MDKQTASARMSDIAAKVLALAKSNDELPAKVEEWIREGGELAKAIASVSKLIIIEHGRISDLRDAIEAMDDDDDGEAWKRA